MKDKINEFPTPFEPKMMNRFMVKLPESIDIALPFIKAINSPTYFPSDERWGDIKISFYDPIAQSTTQKLYDLMKVQGQSEGDCVILDVLDRMGEVVETWEIIIKKIKKIDFGNFDCDCEKENKSICPYIIFEPKNCVLVKI